MHRLAYRLLWSALVVALVAGCDSGEPPADAQIVEAQRAPGGGEAGEPAKQGESEDVERLPQSLGGLFLGRIQSGRWSREEAIIKSLKVMAGQAEADATFGTDDVAMRGTGTVIRVARRYLEKGDDAEAKAKIRRLLNMVTPGPAQLDPYSVPAEAAGQTGNAGKGQSSMLDAFISPARADRRSDCIEKWRAGFPSGGASPDLACFVKITWAHNGNTHYIYYPRNWSGEKAALADRAKSAINKSLDYYERLPAFGGGEPVSMVFQLAGSDYAATNKEGGRCRIAMFPASVAAADRDKLPQTVAHEMFHCSQYAYLKDWLIGDLGMSADEFDAYTEATEWWIEGTAEYFGAQVYPCINGEDEYIDEFDVGSVSHSILIYDMGYANVVFFQYLGNEMGEGAVVELIRALPDRGGTEQQAAGLAAHRDMPDKFQEFGRAYLDAEIGDPCGGRAALPVHPRKGPVLRVKKGEAHEIEVERFQIGRRRLRFGGGEYNLAYDPPGDPAKAGFKEEGAEWREPPDTLDTGCSDKRHQYVVTFAVDSPKGNTYTIEDTNDPVAREQHVDRCLVGRWVSTEGAAETIGRWHAERTSRMPASETRFNDASGRIILRITSGGRAFGETRDLAHSYTQTISDRITAHVDLTTNATSCVDYSARRGEVAMWNIGQEGGTEVHLVMEAENMPTIEQTYTLPAGGPGGGDSSGAPGGGGIPGGGGVPGGGVPGGGGPTMELPEVIETTYRCRGNSLEFDFPEEIMPEGFDFSPPPWKFRRAGG